MEGTKREDKHEAAMPLPLRADDTLEEAKDITEPGAYTIEEAKQKEEEDAIFAAAEAKKRRTRDYLDSLRRQFRELFEENMERPEDIRLPREAFELDTGRLRTACLRCPKLNIAIREV